MKRKTKKAIDLATVRRARAALEQVAEQYPELRAPSGPENRALWETTLEALTTMQNDAQLVIRLPQDLVDRVDAYSERLRAEQPGPKWTRADVVRMLLTRALDALPAAKKGKR